MIARAERHRPEAVLREQHPIAAQNAHHTVGPVHHGCVQELKLHVACKGEAGRGAGLAGVVANRKSQKPAKQGPHSRRRWCSADSRIGREEGP